MMANGNEQWSVTAIVAAVAAIVGPILTLLLTKGKDFLQMLRGESRTDKDKNQELEIRQRNWELEMMQKGYETVIASHAKANEILEKERKEQIAHLNSQITSLLIDLQQVREKHYECETAQAGLRVLSQEQANDIKELRVILERQDAEIVRLRTLLEKSKNGS